MVMSSESQPPSTPMITAAVTAAPPVAASARVVKASRGHATVTSTK
jgi:hypothetical protein